MENVNEQRRNFISLSKLGYGPFKFICSPTFEKSKWVGIIAIETEGKENHVVGS